MRRHRFDGSSLLAGLLFLTVAGVYAVSGLTERTLIPIRILAPSVFIGLGMVGLVRVLTRSRRGDGESP